MIETSANYKKAIKADSRKINAHVSWGFADIGAADASTFSFSSISPISKAEQIKNETNKQTVNIAALEKYYWLLDGSFVGYKENNNWEIGWWSNNLSNNEREINEYINIDLIKKINSVGTSIIFDKNGIASDFIIEYFNDGSRIDTVTVTDNKKRVYVSNKPIDNYNKIKITFSKTEFPERRIKITEFVFGVMVEYTENEILKLGLDEIVSIFADTLASSAISLQVENYDKTLDITNPSGVVKYLQQRQKMECSLSIENESILLGKMYLYKWSTQNSDGTASFELRTITDFLTGQYAPEEYTLGNAKEIIENLLILGGVSDYEVDNSLANITLNKYVAATDVRKALQDAVNAACCYIKVDRAGRVIIKPFTIKNVVTDIDYDNANAPKITQEQMPNKFITSYRTYDADGNTTETEVIKDLSTPGEAINEKKINNPFLATEEQANAMLDAYAAWSKYRLKYEQSWRQDMSLEAGDFALVENDFGEQAVCITENGIDYDGTLSGNYKGYAKSN